MAGFKSKKLLAGRMDPLDLDDIQTLILENERLESGPGGIMEMKQTIANKEQEIERLQDIVTRMSRIYKHLNPEQYPGVYFIHGSLGSYDSNGMPEKLLVVPAYGVDFSYIYERTDKTTGPEW